MADSAIAPLLKPVKGGRKIKEVGREILRADKKSNRGAGHGGEAGTRNLEIRPFPIEGPTRKIRCIGTLE